MSFGAKAIGGALTPSEAETQFKFSLGLSHVRSASYELERQVVYSTGPLADAVVFSAVPYDQYTYAIRSSRSSTSGWSDPRTVGGFVNCTSMGAARPRHARTMHPIARLPSVLIATLLLATTAAQPLLSLPVEDVVDGPIAMSEVTATSATLRVTTAGDLACLVVFGEDERFGQLALDADMGGGAHREHRVLLRGLEPDTEYAYRLQGSDPSGNFYASEVLRFRTLPAEAGASLGVDVATAEAGATIVAASSEYGGGFAAANAIDGDPRSEWSSRGDGDAAFVTVRLREPVEVTGFGLWTRTMGTSAQIERFEVVNELGEVFGPFDVPDAASAYDFAASGRGQEFTFRVLASSGGNTGVVELSVYARPR